MKKNITIELSPKEAFILWNLVCWFDRPLVTSTLKHKLFPKDNQLRNSMRSKFDGLIEDRIIEVAGWLKQQ